MSALDNQTKANVSLALYGQGGGGSPNLDLSTLTLTAGSTTTILETFPGVGQLQTISDATVVGVVRIDDIANGIVLGDSFGNEAIFANGVFTCAVVSTPQVFAQNISTLSVDLDGQLLTANATELLLNGVPLATLSNLSSIGDWAEEPAISTIQAAGFPLIDVPQIVGFSNQLLLKGDALGPQLTMAYDTISPPSSQFIFDTGAGPLMRYRGGELGVSSIVANNVTVSTLTALSTVNVINTISSLVLEGNLVQTSTLFANAFLSTPDIEVSTINGAQFGNSSITVEIVGVSSLVADSISSVGAQIREALVSTLQFNPSFNPSLDVNLGLGSLFGNLAGAAAGGIGVLVGAAGLGTGIAALAQGRQTNNINSNSYELVNGTTQIQISTLGSAFSTIYRFVSSVAENVPGEEYFVSTIHAPGVAIRSLSDPLNTVSSPNSTIQSFGQWVALDANLPIPSTVSTYQQLYTSSLNASTVNFNNGTQFQRGLPFGGGSGVSTTELFWNEASPPLDANLRISQLVLSGDDVGGINYSKDVLITNLNAGNRLQVYGAGGVGPSTIAFLSDIPPPSGIVSTFSTITMGSNGVIDMIEGGSINLGSGGGTNGQLNAGLNPSLILDGPTSEVAVPAVFCDRLGGKNVTQINIETNTILSASTSQMYLSSLALNTQSVSTLTFNGISTINLSTSGTAGTQGQPVGRLVMGGCDLDMGQNDLWVQQIRLGAGNATNAQTELVFYDAANGVRGLNTALQDRTIRVISTVNGTTGGYLLDTALNPPFFSTIGGNVNLMAFFPSTVNSTIGASTISVFPGASINQSTIFTSTITSMGANSTLFMTANSNVSLSMAPQGDLDIVTRDFFIQSQSNGVAKTTLFASATGAGGNGTWAIYNSNGTGLLGASTINISTNRLAVNGVTWPSLAYFASAYNSTSQTVAGANVSTLANLNTTALNVGGFTVSSSNIAVPVAGTYELNASFQFATSSGSANLAQFWLIKNGAAVPQTNSRVTVANNADNLGTVTIFDTAAAGDTYGWMFYSADNNMSATAVAAGATPAIPSLIFNVKRLG